MRRGDSWNGLALRRGLPVLRPRTVFPISPTGPATECQVTEAKGGLCPVPGSCRVLDWALSTG